MTETLDKTETEEKFINFLGRGKSPYDYEMKLLKQNWPRVLAVLKGKKIPPYELEIQPTSKCDAHCSFCFTRNSEGLEDKLTTQESVEKVCKKVQEIDDFYNQVSGLRIKTIKLCGSTGEPFLNPSTPYIIDFFKSRGKNIRGFTNGLEISKRLYEGSYIEAIKLVDNLNLSLDAGSTETLWDIKPGARKKKVYIEDVLAIVPRLKRHGNTNIAISYVINNKNYNEIKKAAENAKRAGADLIRFRVDLTDRTISQHNEEIISQLNEAENLNSEKFKINRIHSEDEIKQEDSEYFASKGKYKCFTCNFWNCISSDANMYGCGHIAVKGSQPYANLLQDSALQAVSSEKRERVLKALPGKKCETCSPFSLRTNQFLTFLSEIPIEQVEDLKEKYAENGS